MFAQITLILYHTEAFSQFCRTLFNTCEAMVSQYLITVRQLAVSAFCHLSHAVSAFCHLSHAVSAFCHLSHGNEYILSSVSQYKDLESSAFKFSLLI